MNNRGRWRIGALASAIALLGSLASLEAHALALGRITVQSALGEPLRAEIDITDITADEAASLKAGVASAETFKAAGLEYTSAITGLEVNLQRRADGRAYLRLSSSRPVTEPFVDLILQANWATGRVTRDYTMLFDPPNLRASNAGTAVAPTAPILSPATPKTAPPVRGTASLPSSAPNAAAPAARPAPVAKAVAAKATPAEKTPASDKQLTVKTGDTAGKIAAQNKPASVSLDQMLVALLRSNPDAFIGGNINRLKSGAVLDIPTAEAASAMSAGEATQTIVAQSKDFNSFRRKLAEGVPTTQVAGADRQAGGKVQAKVEDRAPASATPDKLTLSKGEVQGKAAAAEDKIAKDRQAKDASSRMAELSKNISDLNKLGAAPTTTTTAAAPAASAAKAVGAALPAPAGVAVPATASTAAAAASAAKTGTATTASTSTNATAPAVAASAAVSPPALQAASAAASSPSTATAAIAPASAALSSAAPVASAASAAAAPAPVAVKKPVVAASPPPPEPSLIDALLENPLLPPLTGGLLALLAGFGFYRYRQRNNATAQVDSSFLESRLQPDSFFGASGGQRIDTAESSSATGSSLVYSPSQLDAAGDVDPVAEADVYLAYGRDLQAEEILKEAMRTSPMRVAIHAKLMEIYAKRRDSKAFEVVAIEAFNLTHGNGPEWTYIAEMGRELDPVNPMYQPGGQPLGRSRAGATGSAVRSGPDTMPHATAHGADSAPVPVGEVDLDLDFSLDDEPEAATSPLIPAASAAHLTTAPLHVPEPTVAITPAPISNSLNMDFGSATVTLPMAVSSPAPQPAEALVDLEFLSDGLDFTSESFEAPAKPVVRPSTATAAPAPALADSGMLEFDLGSLSLDLDNGPATESPIHAMTATSDDPLETKFQLAEEFRALGDSDGARSLAEEVLAEAKGPLKVKAQAFLNALS
ncbi:fimbrial protein FimV [Polaromonas sp. P1-6]|nr:fimbrial protein FimV [Polaromonas sp. P1-6]